MAKRIFISTMKGYINAKNAVRKEISPHSKNSLATTPQTFQTSLISAQK